MGVEDAQVTAVDVDPDMGLPVATCMYSYRIDQRLAGGPRTGWVEAFRRKVESRGFTMVGEPLVAMADGVYWVRGFVTSERVTRR